LAHDPAEEGWGEVGRVRGEGAGGGGHPKRYLRGVPHGEGMVWFFIFPFSVQSRRLKTLVANYWTVVSDPPGWPSVRALAIAEPCSIIRGVTVL